jgi:deazaflavin-dependent oxidoreductase (nitroreductase family)
MQIPRGVARFNRVVTNRVQGTWAWLAPPWAVIVHRGRRSGRVYRTPVVASARRGRFRVAILYGERSDWVLNLLAGGGQVVRRGRTYPLIDPRVESGGPSGKTLVASLGEPEPGFGRGPRAS